MYDAKRFFVTSGTGTSNISQINALDSAMLNAGVGDINLIKVSSILPADIERVHELDEDIGVFRPCVLTAAQGKGKHLVAGLAYGFRKDGKGGYVAELSSTADDVDFGEFNKKLKDVLISMGQKRGVEITDIKTVCVELDTESNTYGCALAILVYLQ